MSQFESVLLVDDDPLQITILSAYFAGRKVPEILTACNSARALELVEQHKNRIDLIVSDIQMPEMDGIEFMRHLKNIRYDGKLAIISGVHGTLIEHAAKLAKLHDLDLIGRVKKPIKKAELDLLFAEKAAAEPQTENPKSFEVTPSRIMEAITNKQIYPVYQPKVAVESGNLIGAETLVRWLRNDGTVIRPDFFIPVAEKHNLINEMTFSVLDRVLADIVRFHSTGRDLKIAVNLPPSLITDVVLPDRIFHLIDKYDINSNMISFEVTENSILNLTSEALEVLSRLRINNFDIAVDDFGTGSANINALVDFPYSELKIDKQYITNIMTDDFSREVTTAAVRMARQLNMSVVAEGVEDRETWDFIRKLGIQYAQGFYFARPMNADDFMELASRSQNCSLGMDAA
jgi:EAL domain-containing protein (putative c-di-GMP-specific phosphodiesterase class I)/ActR/RegA family two-component response regulator